MATSQRTMRLLSAAPRAHLFTPRAVHRQFASSTLHSAEKPSGSSPSSFFGSGPAPPRLPEEEQKIFEELQRQSTGAFSTPRAPPRINQSPDASPEDLAQAETTINARTEKLSDAPPSKFKEDYQKIIEARGNGEELHPAVRIGARPEFEGDKNPKTGEVGGPKNDPLRWDREWTYNGRATDF